MTRGERLRKYPRPRLNDEEMLLIEEGFRNNDEAHALLDLINAEFTSDPMSVQCFDSRIVERVKVCVEKRKAHINRRLV